MKKTILSILVLIFSFAALAQKNEQYIVATQNLNMRSGAGTQYDITSKLVYGEVVILLEKTNEEWWNVEHNGVQGYVSSKYLKIDPLSGWETTNYKTGTTPDCENVNPQYDYEIDNYLRINVGSGTDVVVKLMKKGYYKDECIRIVYVRSNDIYDIKNIPEGIYYLKIAYGKDFRKKIIDNKCHVKFMRDAEYEKGIETLDFKLKKMPNQRIGDKIYENWSVPSYELQLDVIAVKGKDSQFRANDISEEEFNK